VFVSSLVVMKEMDKNILKFYVVVQYYVAVYYNYKLH